MPDPPPLDSTITLLERLRAGDESGRDILMARYLPLLRRHGIDPRFENTFLLGVLSRFLPLSREIWLAALAQGFVRAPEENRRIFLLGAETDLGDGT